MRVDRVDMIDEKVKVKAMNMNVVLRGQEIRAGLKTFLSEDVSRQAICYLEMTGFFTSPASSKYHLCLEGGLVVHSHHVANMLLFLTRQHKLTWGCERSPLIVGFLHDVCKAGLYVKQDDGTYKADKMRASLGHGEESLYRIVSGMGIDLTEEEAMCIRWHMGSFDSEKNWDLYTRAIKRYPNVLYTHMADMIASHVIEK